MKFTISAHAPKSLQEGPNEPSKCSEKSFCDPGVIFAHFWCRASAHFCASNLKPKITISAGAPGTPPKGPYELSKWPKTAFGDPGVIFACFWGCCWEAFPHQIRIFSAIPWCFLAFKRLAKIANSHFQRDSIMFFGFHAFREDRKF